MTERAESGSVKSPDDGSCEPRHLTQRILRTIYYQTKQKMTNAKRILVVAGSDSSGGA